MTVIAIIPARGGSRGISRKNLQKVGGKTLVQRSIEHAQAAKSVTKVVVTSDSEEIREHALSLGAEVIERPDELATDDAKGDDVIVHALRALGCNETERPDHLTVFLQPTSPFRRPGLIDKGAEMLWRYQDLDSVFTVTAGHFSWRYKQVSFGQVMRWAPEPVVGSIESRAPRQDIPYDERVLHENGAMYATRTAALLRAGNRITGKIELITIPEEEAIDIDTPYHLWLANARAKWMERRSTPKREAVVTESGVRVVEYAR